MRKEARSELFESKFVKQFIETFNNILELMDDQEQEIKEFVGIPEEEKKGDRSQSKVRTTS